MAEETVPERKETCQGEGQKGEGVGDRGLRTRAVGGSRVPSETHDVDESITAEKSGKNGLEGGLKNTKGV